PGHRSNIHLFSQPQSKMVVANCLHGVTTYLNVFQDAYFTVNLLSAWTSQHHSPLLSASEKDGCGKLPAGRDYLPERLPGCALHGQSVRCLDIAATFTSSLSLRARWLWQPA